MIYHKYTPTGYIKTPPFVIAGSKATWQSPGTDTLSTFVIARSKATRQSPGTEWKQQGQSTTSKGIYQNGWQSTMHGMLLVLFASKAHSPQRRAAQISQFTAQPHHRATWRHKKYAWGQPLLRRHTHTALGGAKRAWKFRLRNSRRTLENLRGWKRAVGQYSNTGRSPRPHQEIEIVVTFRSR